MDNPIGSDLVEKRVLLVDDDSFMQQMIKRILANIGFSHIVTAGDGDEALTILEQQKIDILITDVQMPRMNGLKLLQAVRCGYGDISRNLLTIVITGMTDIHTMGSAIGLDVNGFLTKPFKAEAVVKTLLQALSEDELALRDKASYQKVSTDVDSAGLEDGLDTGLVGESGADVERVSQSTSTSVLLHQLEPGMRLAVDVFGANGVLLLSAGFTLSERAINRLMDLRHMLGEKTFFVEPVPPE